MRVALEGMRFYAYHGFYEEEQAVGGYYLLDVFIDVDAGQAATEDNLAKTVNYETVYEICKIQMRQPRKLIETVLQQIFWGIKKQFQNVRTLHIRLRKLHPPLGGPVNAAYVENAENYVKACGRCGDEILCYNDQFCWCNVNKPHIHPRTLEMLAGQFKGCLCANCLKQFAG